MTFIFGIQPIIVGIFYCLSLSPLTKKEFKAYESLDSYNQFTSG